MQNIIPLKINHVENYYRSKLKTVSRIITIFVLSFILSVSFLQSAYADCSSPFGVAGTQDYNAGNSRFEFCDGTNWQSMKDTLSSFSCTDGQVVSWDDGGSAWVCADGASGGSSTASTMVTDWPDAIKCGPWIFQHSSNSDGTFAGYRSTGGGQNLATLCGSKSNAQLYADGQAFNFVGGNGSAFTCPSGFTLIENAGQTMGCMQTDDSGTNVSWDTAVDACFDNYGGRLPNNSEWTIATANYTLTNETGNWEWLSDSTGESGGYNAHTQIGNSSLTSYNWAINSSGYYRCFIPASGGSNSSGADDLGDHTATENIQLGSYYLSGDGGDEGVYVDSDGEVGIGTIDPGASLDIHSSSTDNLHLNSTGTANTIMRFQDEGTETATIYTLNGEDDLHLRSAGQVWLDGGGNSTGSLVVDSSGNIGIGLGGAAATQKLDVSGTVKATAFVGDGSALTNLPSGSSGFTSCSTSSAGAAGTAAKTCSSGTMTGGGCSSSVALKQNYPSGNGWYCSVGGFTTVTAYVRCCQ